MENSLEGAKQEARVQLKDAVIYEGWQQHGLHWWWPMWSDTGGCDQHLANKIPNI